MLNLSVVGDVRHVIHCGKAMKRRKCLIFDTFALFISLIFSIFRPFISLIFSIFIMQMIGNQINVSYLCRRICTKG